MNIQHARTLRYFNDHAKDLSRLYDTLNRSHIHADLLNLIAARGPLRVLDVGAGSGADARLFANLGHKVFATEPAEALRSLARVKRSANRIIWNSDSLPDLSAFNGFEGTFDVVLATGVLQYLKAPDRRKALRRLFNLTAEKGIVSIQYPTPASRVGQLSPSANEISKAVESFNKNGRRLDILQDTLTLDQSARKALNGKPLRHRHCLLTRKA